MHTVQVEDCNGSLGLYHHHAKMFRGVGQFIAGRRVTDLGRFYVDEMMAGLYSVEETGSSKQVHGLDSLVSPHWLQSLFRPELTPQLRFLEMSWPKATTHDLGLLISQLPRLGELSIDGAFSWPDVARTTPLMRGTLEPHTAIRVMNLQNISCIVSHPMHALMNQCPGLTRLVLTGEIWLRVSDGQAAQYDRDHARECQAIASRLQGVPHFSPLGHRGVVRQIHQEELFAAAVHRLPLKFLSICTTPGTWWGNGFLTHPTLVTYHNRMFGVALGNLTREEKRITGLNALQTTTVREIFISWDYLAVATVDHVMELLNTCSNSIQRLEFVIPASTIDDADARVRSATSWRMQWAGVTIHGTRARFIRAS